MEGTMTNKRLSATTQGDTRMRRSAAAMGVTPEEYASMSHGNRVRFKEDSPKAQMMGISYLEFCTLCTAEKKRATKVFALPPDLRTPEAISKIRADLRGQVFGDWRVLTKYSGGNNSDARWTCLCSCGHVDIVSDWSLRAEKSKSCMGCSMQRKNWVGKRCGRLFIKAKTNRSLRYFDKSGNLVYTSPIYLADCDCGTKDYEIKGRDLSKNTSSKSCGCLKRETLARVKTTHGQSRSGRDGKYTQEYALWTNARARARAKGVPCNIELQDVVIPDRCPILGTQLVFGEGEINRASASLDRIFPEKGYVKGNVWVISQRANAIKTDATVDEIEAVARGLRAKLKEMGEV